MKADLRDVLEYLVPFVFVVLWVLGNILASKKKKGEGEEEEEEGELPRNPMEEMFGVGVDEEIQQEIRERALAERRRREAAQRVRPVVSKKEEGRRDYMAELEEQRRRIRETAQEAKVSSLEWGGKKKGPCMVKPASEAVLELLKDPHVTQKAFLSYEILGTPVGLRKDGGTFQSWNH